MNPKVSILLAVYNDEKYLEECVLSIINQTYNNFELLIGFNGTHDKSKDIISQFDDERIKTFDFGDDKGKSKTLNKMLPHATGDWIAVQDGDDVWFPKKLQEQMMLSNEYDVIGTYCQYIDAGGQFIGQPSIASSHENIVTECMGGVNQIINSSSLIRKSHAIEANGWDENCWVEDYDLWLKLIKKGSKFYNVPKVLVLHRLHNESNFNTHVYDTKSLLKKYL